MYTDDTFTFEQGAFETVDRDYGKWVNQLSHHIVRFVSFDYYPSFRSEANMEYPYFCLLSHAQMDGHVIHHLFFTKVLYYRLKAASTALQEGLKERGQEHIYKQIDTPDYSQEIVKQIYDNWFFIKEDQVMRE